MATLRNLETKLADLVEGTFGRVFRSEVRPVEIARRLAREMEENKRVSVSHVYVPNDFVVYLSPDDRQRLGEVEEAMKRELSAHLLEHARRERLALIARPVIDFRTDGRLKLGEFGVEARLGDPPADAGRAPAAAPAGPPGHGGLGTDLHAPAPQPADARRLTAVLHAQGRRLVVEPPAAVIGRSRDCDVVVDDGNVSRRHAQLRLEGATWTVQDLGSTNGVVVNGRPTRGAHPLASGDVIELGTSSLRFELEP